MQRSLIFSVAAILTAATAAYAAPPAPDASKTQAGDPRDRIICRRQTEIGTLARIIRTCKTRREWDAQAANIRAARNGVESCSTNGVTGEVVCQ